MTKEETAEKILESLGCKGKWNVNKKKAIEAIVIALHTEFSLADLLAVREVLEDRLDRLRKDRDSYRGRDMDRYVEKDFKYHNDPYYDKLERVEKTIFELIEKI